MLQVTYISTARSMYPTSTEIQEILASCRKNNVRNGLSGLLIVAGRRFLQVLEGPASACEASYDRIKTDPRHFALVELGRKKIEQPSFPQWAMGFEEPGSHDLLQQVELLTGKLEDPYLREHLLSFAQLHLRAA